MLVNELKEDLNSVKGALVQEYESMKIIIEEHGESQCYEESLEKIQKDSKESSEKLAQTEAKMKVALPSHEKLKGELLYCQGDLNETYEKYFERTK